MKSSYERVEYVLVYYPIKAINKAFKNSLYHFLSENVMSERGLSAEEDLRLGDDRYVESECIETVRYQFGDSYEADESADDIQLLVEKYTSEWVSRNGGYEVVGA